MFFKPIRDFLSSPETEKARREAIFLAVITTVALLPFIGKAFHVDDPFYLWVAKHIQNEPLDFFGLTVNWCTTLKMSLAEVNQNPPLVSYFYALAAFLVGWSEIGLHLASILPAVAVVLGTFALARRLGVKPVNASLTMLFTPAFLVASTTVMSDILMLAFYCWAVFFWLRGLQESRRSDLLIGALLCASCALTKYFGITLIPLLAVHTLLQRDSSRKNVLFLAIPIALLVAYDLYTRYLYGHGHLSAAMGYVVEFRTEDNFVRGWGGVIFAGGCVASLLFFLPLLLHKRLLLLVVAACTCILSITLIFSGSLSSLDLSFKAMTHAILFGAAGLLAAGLAITELVERRNSASLLLAIWVLGTLIFAALVNWTTNVRAVLPLTPPLAIILWGQIETYGKEQSIRRLRIAAAFALSVVLAISIAWGDLRLANSARDAASILSQKYGQQSRALWFQGHWGFHYYMELHQAQLIEIKNSVLDAGDLVVLPKNNACVYGTPPGKAILLETLRLPVSAFVGTMSQELGAGMYTTMWGPFPFTFGKIPPERYEIWRVTKPFSFRNVSLDLPGQAMQ